MKGVFVCALVLVLAVSAVSADLSRHKEEHEKLHELLESIEAKVHKDLSSATSEHSAALKKARKAVNEAKNEYLEKKGEALEAKKVYKRLNKELSAAEKSLKSSLSKKKNSAANELELIAKIRKLLGEKKVSKAPETRYGYQRVPAWGSGMKCVRVNFDQAFSSSVSNKNVRVQASITHRSYGGGGTHDASILHLEGIDRKGFVGCVYETKHHGSGGHDSNLHIEYLAVAQNQVPYSNSIQSGRINQGSWRGTHCENFQYPHAFPSGASVNLQATLNHWDHSSRHDSTTLWLERVTRTEFRWCMREQARHDGPHARVSIDWVAATRAVPLPETRTMEGTVRFSAWGGGSKCAWVSFKGKFSRTPKTVLATINHKSYGGNGAHDSVTIWGENVQKNRARLCVRELAHHGGGGHDNNLHIDFVAIQ